LLQTATGQVSCPEGEKPLGGGVTTANSDPLRFGLHPEEWDGNILDDGPTPTGWVGRVYNSGPLLNTPAQVYAICAFVS